jgi:hypothetical protein
MTKTSMILFGAGLSVIAVLVPALPGHAAGVDKATTSVKPHQAFVGLVNGDSADATVAVICPGPIRLGQTGYAASGQTVAVEPASTVASSPGFTGTKADSIVAELPTPASTSTAAEATVTFTAYGSQPIPTTVLLPCNGSSTALFVPRPTSKTARSAEVSFRFVATCGGPVCPVTVRNRARL